MPSIDALIESPTVISVGTLLLTNKLRHTNATRRKLIISRFVSLSWGKTVRYYSSRCIHRTSACARGTGNTCHLLVFQLPDWMLTFSLRRIIHSAVKRLLFKGKCHFYCTRTSPFDCRCPHLTRERAPINCPFYALNAQRPLYNAHAKMITRLVYLICVNFSDNFFLILGIFVIIIRDTMKCLYLK
jgi:hypothetical protein